MKRRNFFFTEVKGAVLREIIGEPLRSEKQPVESLDLNGPSADRGADKAGGME